MAEWLPIETAPKDGRLIWIVDEDYSVVKANWRRKGDKYFWREHARGGLKCRPLCWFPVDYVPDPPTPGGGTP